jgi:AbrB family looped-hinge helix DNA binding protein
MAMMPRSKVTAKYQVTIPREVREKIGVEAGEVVSVEAVSKAEIRLRRFPGVSDPLSVLVGRRTSRKSIPIEELEEKAESR